MKNRQELIDKAEQAINLMIDLPVEFEHCLDDEDRETSYSKKIYCDALDTLSNLLIAFKQLETINVQGLKITKESIEKVADQTIPVLQEYIDDYELEKHEIITDQLNDMIYNHDLLTDLMYGAQGVIINRIFEKMGIEDE